MHTSTVKYLGDLRTECTHEKSQTKIITDAPVDNNGKGSAFSPTDLVATAYASCVMTIMGVFCQTHGINFEKGEAKVTKVMSDAPRKIAKIVIEMNLQGNNWDEKTTQKIINAGKACPVGRSLDKDVEIEYTYIV
ncbi:MAG: OsmC family protein [Bacteroidota bacterium]